MSPAWQRGVKGTRTPSHRGRSLRLRSSRAAVRPPATGKTLWKGGGLSNLTYYFCHSPSDAANEKAILARDWKEKGDFSWPRGLSFLCFGAGSVFSPHGGAAVVPVAAGGRGTGAIYPCPPHLPVCLGSPLKFARKCHCSHKQNNQ